MPKAAIVGFGCVVAVACGLALAASGCSEAASAPRFVKVSPAIAGEYIVVLPADLPAERVANEAKRLTSAYGGRVTHRYAGRDSALRGFAVTGMQPARARALASDKRVKYVEQAAQASAAWRRTTPGWALDRIDQRSGTLSGEYRYSADGSGVHVYVLDTGIQPGHPEFFASKDDFDATGGTGAPCNEHGTAMAGLIAGQTVGVAPAAEIVNVKVLDCNLIGGNSTADIVAGVQWVTANAIAPAVANLSLQLQPGTVSPTLRTAIADLVNSDVVVVVAAGNDNVDIAQVEPANYPGVLAVGGSLVAGGRWVDPGSPATGCGSSPGCGSNVGAGVDLFAPVTAHTATTGGGYITPTGTSVSAAIVSGVAAQTLQAFQQAPQPGILAIQTPGQRAQQILLANATAGALTNIGASPDRLVFAETWPISVERFDVNGLSGPTSVSASASAYGSTPALSVSAGFRNRFDDTPALNSDPFAAQAFGGNTPRWLPAAPVIPQAGCSDVLDVNIAYQWLACTRMTAAGPRGFVRSVSALDGSTQWEMEVGLALQWPPGQTCTQAHSIARALAITPNGGLYVAGDAWCDSKPRSAFLASLDTQPTYIFWQRRIFDQGTTSSVAHSLAVDGSIVTVAGAQTTAGSPSTARVGLFDATTGASVTATSPVPTGASAAYAVSKDDPTQRVYAGTTQSTAGGNTGMLTAYTAGLTKLWEQPLNGARINGVAALKDGVLVAGETARHLPFWPITDSSLTVFIGLPMSPRGFLMRFDASGTLRWTRYIAGGAVVGLAAEGRNESGSSVLADIVGVAPDPPCPPGSGTCLLPPRTAFVESFRVK